MKNKEIQSYLLLKTGSYQIVSLIKLVLISWVLTGSLTFGSLIGIIFWIISFAVYWVHEQLFYKVYKRLKNKRKQANETK